MGSAITETSFEESVSRDDWPPPFYVSKEQERELRLQAGRLSPSLTVAQATSFDEYVRQLMVPPAVMDLVRKASSIRLSTWEAEGIRTELEPEFPEFEGFLRKILKWKVNGIRKPEFGLKLDGDASHPPYIRVACTGKGDFDLLAENYLRELRDSYGAPRDDSATRADDHYGDYGSPVALEIWPAQHYSPIHSHGNTTGIIYCLAGQVDVMAYKELKWDATKLGLLTLTPGQCAWLSSKNFAVHKVYCPMDGECETLVPHGPLLNKTGDYAATFHVYLNRSELAPESLKPALEYFDPEPDTRDVFKYVQEDGKEHKVGNFTTFSDLSWSILRRILVEHARFRSDDPVRID
jgi:hypothetical protein